MKLRIDPIAPNQTVLNLSPSITVLFSYRTPVAALVHGTYYRTAEFHSVTTSRHINKWLNDHGAIGEQKPQAWFDDLLDPDKKVMVPNETIQNPA